ncbi:hypothetical protein [Streptomyces sp. NPDC001450]
MWLVLCAPDDHAALWAYMGLRTRGLQPLELVTSEALILAPRCAHYVEEGRAAFDITLPDGRTLRSEDVKGVLNRLPEVPAGLASADGSSADAHYALTEIGALLLSWLACVAPVAVNRPSARGLSGAWRSPAEWTVLASRAGLPVTPLSLPGGADRSAVSAPPRTVIVFREHVFASEGVAELADGCRRLALLADTALLGIEFRLASGTGPPKALFAGATPRPDLRAGGPRLLDRLFRHFTDATRPAVRRT